MDKIKIICTSVPFEYTAPWRMPRRRCPVGRETAQGGPHQHGTGRREERSAADVGGLCVSVHGGVLRTRRLHALTSSVRRVEQAGSQTQESGLRMRAASEYRHVSRARMPSATLA